MPSLAQRGVAECLGTAFLLATVVGSGIMAQRLAVGNEALALLCNTLPTGAILTVLILTFGPLSGAHFNPAVSVAFALRREIPWPEAAAFIVVQIIGGIIGVWAAHAMFELPLWQISFTERTGPGQWFAEFVAAFGLVLTILGCLARTPAAIPYAAGLYITAAYWFTAAIRYLRRHRPRQCHSIHRRPARWYAGGRTVSSLALDRDEDRKRMTALPDRRVLLVAGPSTFVINKTADAGRCAS
jgi:glycerol uptake facilitator-like aquaporin